MVKLEKNIQNATRQLASYEAQQKGLEDSLKNLNKQYEKQKKEGKDPAFDPKEFGIEDETGAWK